MSWQISLRTLIGCFCLLAIIVASVTNWLASSTRYARINEEGLCLARALHSSKGDFYQACISLREDPPSIGVDFLDNWAPAGRQKRIFDGRAVIALRKTKFRGRELVLLEDFGLCWVDKDESGSSVDF